MNYLAHAHLANVSQTSILGNLLGDFTKGVDIAELTAPWQLGVKLHRSIDAYTDNHDTVLEMKREFGAYRRYAGIALDIIFDHILAKSFEQLSTISLTEFVNHTHSELTTTTQEHILLPKIFQQFLQRLTQGRWLMNSTKLEHIEQALHHTGRRLSSQPSLENTLSWYVENSERVDAKFLLFYKDLQKHTLEKTAWLTYTQQIESEGLLDK